MSKKIEILLTKDEFDELEKLRESLGWSAPYIDYNDYVTQTKKRPLIVDFK